MRAKIISTDLYLKQKGALPITQYILYSFVPFLPSSFPPGTPGERCKQAEMGWEKPIITRRFPWRRHNRVCFDEELGVVGKHTMALHGVA